MNGSSLYPGGQEWMALRGPRTVGLPSPPLWQVEDGSCTLWIYCSVLFHVSREWTMPNAPSPETGQAMGRIPQWDREERCTDWSQLTAQDQERERFRQGTRGSGGAGSPAKDEGRGERQEWLCSSGSPPERWPLPGLGRAVRVERVFSTSSTRSCRNPTWRRSPEWDSCACPASS